MITQEKILAYLDEHPADTVVGLLARETLRVRKILQSYMETEQSIRWAFMQYRDGKDPAPDFDNPTDVKHFLIDPALATLYQAADDATLLSIILNACLKNGIDNREHYQLSAQVVTRILKTDEINGLRSENEALLTRIRELETQ